MRARGQRLVALDGMRGLAAGLVVLFHVGNLSGDSTPFSRGYLAVDFFFMLSGFVLAPVLESGGDGARKLAARIVRFWPLAAVGALIGLAVHARDPAIPDLPLKLAEHLIFLPSDSQQSSIFVLNQPQWSLFCELALNGLHIAVLQKQRTRIVLAMALIGWIAATIGAIDLGSFDIGAGVDVLGLGFLRAFAAYALGIVLRRSGALQGTRLRSAPWWAAPTLLAVLIVVPALLRWPAAAADPLVALAFAPVLAIGATATPPRAAGRALSALGALSFPLYAIHFPLLEAPHVWGLAGFIPRLASAMAALVLAAALARTPLAHGLRRATLARQLPQAA